MHTNAQPSLLFVSPETSRYFAEPLSRALGSSLSGLEERSFVDGEFSVRPLENLQGRQVILVQSFHRDHTKSVGDKLCELLFICCATRDAGAARIMLAAPYLCFGRSDRPIGFQGPVLSRSVAELLEAAGVQAVITMDAHNPSAYHNAFRCPAYHVSAMNAFARYFHEHLTLENPAVVSPDLGGMKRCSTFRDAFCEQTSSSMELCVASKHRVDHVVDERIILGSVRGKDAIILDDMISTGSTLVHAIHACEEQGARRIFIAATHGLFAEGAEAQLAQLPIERLVLTNTVTPYQLETPALRDRLAVIDVSGEFADALSHQADSRP
jgi:ribose-phosphate pyrophosphokinase